MSIQAVAIVVTSGITNNEAEEVEFAETVAQIIVDYNYKLIEATQDSKTNILTLKIKI